MIDEMPTPSAVPETPAAPVWKQFLATPRGKLAVLAIALLAALGLLTAQVYARPVTDGLVRSVARLLPYPALSVNGEGVTIKEFLIEYDALVSYFQDADEPPPPGDQLEVAIADTLINKIAIRQLAQAYDVELDRAQVEQYYQDVLAGQESEEAFVQNLSDTFGWTPEEFRERIVESIVLALQMTDAVLERQERQAPRAALVQEAYGRVEAGEDFAIVAKDVHAGFDGAQSDLGYVKASILPSTWASQVNALAEGEYTSVIELPEGYVVFKLEEKIAAGEDTQLHLLSITVPKVTLQEVVEEYLESAKVKRYVGEA